MNDSKVTLLSTDPSNRILSLDLLRGIAVLGILFMNIQSFSMIGAAYINPAAYGDLTGLNKWVWIISHLLASQKFMSIFSMLFGAGIILFTERAVIKGKSPGLLHYRRNFWLLIFGMVHAYLIWYGDILVAYSLCAFIAFVFRKLKPRTLVFIATGFFVIPLFLYLFMGMSIQYWPEEAYQNNLQGWLPSAEKISHELAGMRGGYLDQMDHRIEGAIFMQTFLFIILVFWRVMSMMLLGMALYKWGVLSLKKSKAFYTRMTLIGLFTGYIIVGPGIYSNFQAGWSMDYSMFLGSQFNYIGSVAVAFGYVGLVMLIAQSNCCSGFKRVFTAVGKMAFTNYILMSVIASFIFYGHGLGLYGSIERTGQAGIVLAIWLVLLIISPIWLSYFRYGPLEWLWRILTYWKRQPNRK